MNWKTRNPKEKYDAAYNAVIIRKLSFSQAAEELGTTRNAIASRLRTPTKSVKLRGRYARKNRLNHPLLKQLFDYQDSLDISNLELAKKSGYGSQFIGQLRNGILTKPGLIVIEDLANALGIRLMFDFGTKEDDKSS